MGGEELSAVVLDERGLAGDRWYAVEDENGHFASGKNTRRFRRRDAVFNYAATTTEAGDVAVTRGSGVWKMGDPTLDDELSRAMGTRVRVTPEAAVPHQDMGAVSLIGTATLDWCAERFGIAADPRRLRVNIVFSTHEPFVEERWGGSAISVGGATLRIVERVPRCRMIDIAQDGVVADGRWLKPLARERDMFLAMYADVMASGMISIGDSVTPPGRSH